MARTDDRCKQLQTGAHRAHTYIQSKAVILFFFKKEMCAMIRKGVGVHRAVEFEKRATAAVARVASSMASSMASISPIIIIL